MNRTVAVVVGGLCAGMLAGCTWVSTAPTTPPTPSATHTPTPSPSSSAMEQSDPGLGIVFLDPPTLTGEQVDVYNWIATYDKEYWRTLTTNQVSPALAIMASAEVQTQMQQMATENANTQSQATGTFEVHIIDVTVDGDTARGSECDSFGKVTFADNTGPRTLESEGVGQPANMELTLRRGAAPHQWMIVTSTRTGSC